MMVCTLMKNNIFSVSKPLNKTLKNMLKNVFKTSFRTKRELIALVKKHVPRLIGKLQSRRELPKFRESF